MRFAAVWCRAAVHGMGMAWRRARLFLELTQAEAFLAPVMGYRKWERAVATFDRIHREFPKYIRPIRVRLGNCTRVFHFLFIIAYCT